MADKPFNFGEKSIRDNQDMIRKLRELRMEDIDEPEREVLVQDQNGESAQFLEPELGSLGIIRDNGDAEVSAPMARDLRNPNLMPVAGIETQDQLEKLSPQLEMLKRKIQADSENYKNQDALNELDSVNFNPGSMREKLRLHLKRLGKSKLTK